MRFFGTVTLVIILFSHGIISLIIIYLHWMVHTQRGIQKFNTLTIKQNRTKTKIKFIARACLAAVQNGCISTALFGCAVRVCRSPKSRSLLTWLICTQYCGIALVRQLFAKARFVTRRTQPELCLFSEEARSCRDRLRESSKLTTLTLPRNSQKFQSLYNAI